MVVRHFRQWLVDVWREGEQDEPVMERYNFYGAKPRKCDVERKVEGYLTHKIVGDFLVKAQISENKFIEHADDLMIISGGEYTL